MTLSNTNMHVPDFWVQMWHKIQSLWLLFSYLDPWFSVALFMGTSMLMLWRLGALERKGLEGTVLGTLVMPYASGFSNLIFAYVMGNTGGNGLLVLENCLVNNVTNFTLLIGLPAMLWGLNIFPQKSGKRFDNVPLKTDRLNRLSLLLTLFAVFFFTGALWALSRDAALDFGDGLVLVGMFFFWQIFQVFDVLKQSVNRGRALNWWAIAGDAFLVIVAGVGLYVAIEHLVAWIPRSGPGWLVFDNLGWLSGLLMVLPNAFLALYYARAKRADIVYSSQIGDGHICIPMCIGLFALFSQVRIPAYFNLSVLIIIAASLVHFSFVAIMGRLPRVMGLLFTGAYAYFIYKGLIHQ
jgi:cation:H+ antiporter